MTLNLGPGRIALSCAASGAIEIMPIVLIITIILVVLVCVSFRVAPLLRARTVCRRSLFEWLVRRSSLGVRVCHAFVYSELLKAGPFAASRSDKYYIKIY